MKDKIYLTICLLFLVIVLMAMPFRKVFAYSPLYLSKYTYLLKDGNLTMTSTFNAGDTVMVKIYLDPSTTGRSFTVEDMRPLNSIASQTMISSRADCALADDAKLLSASYERGDDGGLTSFKNIEPNQAGYLCYSYKLIYNPLPTKNILESVTASAVSDSIFSAQKVETAKNYILVKGEPPDAFSRNDDKLTVFYKNDRSAANSGDNTFLFNPAYTYVRGEGPFSRAGEMYDLPFQMTDLSGQRVFHRGNFYLLYNPLYSVLGNVFSSGASLGGSLDFNSKSNAISQAGNAFTSKLNSEAALYNYSFDRSSALYWDASNTEKNDKMNRAISILTSAQKPDVVCNLSQASLGSGNYFLNNPNCQIKSSSSSKIWPNGRVWLVKATGSINLNGSINGRGTLLVDFSSAPASSLNLQNLSFAKDASLGIILTGGGSVAFDTNCSEFRGLVFAPGANGNGGEIGFAKDGSALKISGSLVANQINFNPRSKNGSQYAVSISTDQNLLNSPLPGFDALSTVVFGQ